MLERVAFLVWMLETQSNLRMGEEGISKYMRICSRCAIYDQTILVQGGAWWLLSLVRGSKGQPWRQEIKINIKIQFWTPSTFCVPRVPWVPRPYIQLRWQLFPRGPSSTGSACLMSPSRSRASRARHLGPLLTWQTYEHHNWVVKEFFHF